jgi:hypothetical protein
MKIVLFIILVVLLVGCSEFETLMEDRRMLTCSPSYETLCAGWQI